MPQIDLSALRQAVRENRYLITAHALRRMGLRRVTHDDLKLVLINAR